MPPSWRSGSGGGSRRRAGARSLASVRGTRVIENMQGGAAQQGQDSARLRRSDPREASVRYGDSKESPAMQARAMGVAAANQGAPAQGKGLKRW